ncbi:hypothetical protein ACJRO7_026721 [Eucalyptus globulus]|uniref:Uncharacterized protein n=1 Tax=Eucalyptus globulus TaxID=34317 RepID=A0ABD3JRM5_EUCGL
MPSSLVRWLSLVALIWLQTIAGTNTNFLAYSSQLKQVLSISQTRARTVPSKQRHPQMTNVARTAHLPLWVILLVGVLLGLVGNGIQYLFVASKAASVSYPGMFLLAFLAGNSIRWINTVCYVVAINNFPLHRQVAVRLTTSYQGLSSGLFPGSSKTSSLVSLSSSFGFFGRLIPSLFERRKYVASRPASMAELMAPMVGAYFLLLSPATWALYVSTAVSGVNNIRDTGAGAQPLATLPATKRYWTRFPTSPSSAPTRRTTQRGRCAVRATFVIWGCLCLLGTVLALVLYARTRKFYSRSIER